MTPGVLDGRAQARQPERWRACSGGRLAYPCPAPSPQRRQLPHQQARRDDRWDHEETSDEPEDPGVSERRVHVTGKPYPLDR